MGEENNNKNNTQTHSYNWDCNPHTGLYRTLAISDSSSCN